MRSLDKHAPLNRGNVIKCQKTLPSQIFSKKKKSIKTLIIKQLTEIKTM